MRMLSSCPGVRNRFLFSLWALRGWSLFAAGCLSAAISFGQPVVSAARHKIQVRDPAVASTLEAQGGRLVADYGSYQLFEYDQLPVALAGRPELEPRDQYNFIFLNATRLDTSKSETQALRKSVGQFACKHLHLVQFAGPIQAAWREEILAAGAEIVTYIPENTYLVYGDAAALGRIQALAAAAPHVQWEGIYLDDYKIHPRARSVDAQGRPRNIGTELFAIQLVADAQANAATVALLAPQELQSKWEVLNYVNLVVSLKTAERVRILAAQSEVVSIQPYFVPQKFDERQDQIVAGNLANNGPSGPGYLSWLASKGFTPAQFTASGFVVDLSDSGVDNGTTMPFHPGLYALGDTNGFSRVVYNRLEGTANPGSSLMGCDGHGTLNSHVIGGYDDVAGFPYADANGYHYGLGICPFVKVGSSVIFDPNSFTRPNFTALQSRAYRDGARVSNNSWGSSGMGLYTSSSQEYDALVRDAQPAGSPNASPGNQSMVIVFANGNSGAYGSESVSPPATGKNVFSIGASENVQPIGDVDGCGLTDADANNVNDVASFSSLGPCLDGRHKPDLMAPGTRVTGGVVQAAFPSGTGQADPCFDGSGVCGSATTPFFPPGQELFTISDGTSHSTPCVAGACALLRQYFINTFTNTPSPAMTKAYLMNSARYMSGAGANDALWSDSQGMGELNLGMAFDSTPRMLRDQLAADLFTQSGQSLTFLNQIADPAKPLRVTIAWTDAPGNTTGNAYNNNLDLTVTVGGTTYKGNVFSGQYSIAGGIADSQNNVESVFLPAGTVGLVTVTVTATSINSDGVPNNSTPLDQDFAQVVYNVAPPPPVINSLQPTNLMVISGQPASFTVSASGLPPLNYQWYKGSSGIAGATASVFSIAAAQLSDSGTYSVVVTNLNGSVRTNATLTVVPTVPLPFALDTLSQSNFSWTSDPAVPWFGQTNVFHVSGTNTAAARSYFVPDNQQSTLWTTVTGPGTLSFYWKVSSEPNADILTFSDPAAGYTSQISGEVDWTKQSYLLPGGAQVLEWTYAKNAMNNRGLDAGFVDQVTFTLGATLPTISRQPIGVASLASVPVTFTVKADGTPVLSYQWRFEGNDIPGATSASLTLSSPSVLDTGVYSVRVSNPYGFTLSTGAYLGIVPLVARGDNSLGQIGVPLLTTNIVGVAAGAWHSLFLHGDGTLLALGENYDGQCNVANLRNLMAIAAGGYHSLGIQRDGTVTGWGANGSGQATPPPGLSNVTALAAGTWHSLALRSDGTVAAWGDNSFGQCAVPPGLSNVVAIAANGSHSLALRADGSLVAWGENTDASGSFAGESVVPFGLSSVAAIGAGNYNSLAAMTDGTLLAWGDNSQGQSQPPQGANGVVGIAAGAGHSIALKRDSTILAWGNDWNGQCDFDTGVSNVIAIAAGNAHSLLLEGNRFAVPQLLYPTRQGRQFSVWVQTFYGRSYALEYKNSLATSTWNLLTTVRGNGARQFLVDTAADSPQRFYRVRQY